MPRIRNTVAIAAGKLIVAIQKEASAPSEETDRALAQKVMSRARTLLQATESSSVLNLLDGRSVAEYLDSDWVKRHPSVQPCIDVLIGELRP